MTELERFAAVLLAERQGEGHRPESGIEVSELLDRTFPYRTARRLLSLDSAEDYDALMLRLIAGEAGLMTANPIEAAEMARTTMSAKVPDLEVLQLLRTTTVSFTDDAISQLEGVRPLPHAQSDVGAVEDEATPDREPGRAEPGSDQDVIPFRRTPADVTRTPAPRRPAEPTPDFLTEVAFKAPTAGCWSCAAPLPAGRAVNFCVECGADQRQPTCPACEAPVEREWKHCAECGAHLR